MCWQVDVRDAVGGGADSQENARHLLYVPQLETWMPDTLRLVLHELSAYIPAHDPADALVTIGARTQPQRGRAPKVPRARRFDHHVTIAVEARGWRAEVHTWRDSRKLNQGEYAPDPGSFTEPMQAFLLDLAAHSPFPLAPIHRELSAPGCERDQMPSRLNVMLGDEAPWDAERKEWRDDVADATLRVRNALDRLLGRDDDDDD